MATVNEQIAQQVIAGNGYYADDQRVMRVITYKNIFTAEKSWAILYKQDLDSGRYDDVGLDGPTIVWDAKTADAQSKGNQS